MYVVAGRPMVIYLFCVPSIAMVAFPFRPEETMTTSRLNRLGLVLALVGAVATGGCGRGKAEATPAGRAAQAVPVTTTHVVRRTVPIRVSAIGTAEASSTVTLRSRIDGQVVSANFKPGAPVREGQVLFRLDARSLAAELRVAQANLARDQAQLANARRDLSRYSVFTREGYATQQKLDDAKASVATLSETVRADQAAVDLARLQLSYTTIASPLGGIAGNILADPGNTVKANDTALVVINQVSPINVTFSVPESRLGQIRKRLSQGEVPVEVSLPGGNAPVDRGRLVFVNNQVDASTGTIQLKAAFANDPPTLTPGQFLNVSMVVGAWRDALVVPSQAVQTDQNGEFVFIVRDDKTVAKRTIAAVTLPGGQAVVRKGLAQGEEVVVDGQLRLRPGSRIVAKPLGTL